MQLEQQSALTFNMFKDININIERKKKKEKIKNRGTAFLYLIF